MAQTQAEKDAAKAAKQAEKDAAKLEDTSGDIVVNDPQVLRPTELPLVVVLPEGASKAQQAYAKILNVYAYQNPEKWATKKDDQTIQGPQGPVVVKGFITLLRELKDAPDPVEEGNLKIGGKLAA